MNRTTYISLLFFTLGLTAYTGYYAFTRPDTAPVITMATTTLPLLVEEPAKNLLTTKTGKTITVNESNPAGQGLSTITLLLQGFIDNTEIALEKNKLTDYFLIDLDKDGFDELALITTAEGNEKYGEITLYSTKDDAGLIAIDTPIVSEGMTKKGGLFEGYTGQDVFIKKDGLLIREFPLNTGTDTKTLPTGETKKLIYVLNVVDGKYTLALEKESATTTLATSTLMATSTIKTVATSTKSTATSSVR